VKKSQIYYLRDEINMLIEFSVGNYRSFKEKVTFSMVAANLVSQDKNLDINNVFAVGKELSLLKSAAIYGANASGKSNLAKALQFMKWFMVNSSKETQSTEAIGVEKFRLSTETDDQPSFFEIVFLLDGQQHRYGFTADRENVQSEWLYYVPKTRETKIFDRQENKFDITKVLKADGIASKTRSNALFLSVSAQFNIRKSEEILNWLTYEIVLISALNDSQGNIEHIFREDLYNEVVQFIDSVGLGIDGFELGQIESSFYEKIIADFIARESDPDRIKGYTAGVLAAKDESSKQVSADRIMTKHKKFNDSKEFVSMEYFSLLRNESDGTQEIFALVSLLINALKIGRTLIIDEFDARLHPLLSQAIIKLFNSNETNPKNAQLILMTHDTNLLSNKIFRRDQIWFTEKDRYGATFLYSLAEYKVRNDASYGSDYIKGKYGAIPYIQGAESLIEAHA
jgi:uncharacterized protein